MATGANISVRYKREAYPASGLYSAHDVSGDANWKVFGHDLKLNTTFKNTLKKGYGLGGRQATRLDPTIFDVSAGLEFKMANPWWLHLLFGKAPTTTGVGPYSHYYLDTANENAGGAVVLGNTIPAFTIQQDIELGATDSSRLLQGCFVESASISAAVEGEVEVKLNCPFRYITKSAGAPNAQVVDTESIFTFAHGALKLPTGTTLASVQNISLDINNKPTMGKGLGSRFGTRFDLAAFEVGISASMYFVADADILDYVLGSTTVPTTPTETTLDLVFDNGGAGIAQRQISFKFTGVKLEEYTLAAAIENPVIDEWKPEITTMTLAKAINNTTVAI